MLKKQLINYAVLYWYKNCKINKYVLINYIKGTRDSTCKILNKLCIKPICTNTNNLGKLLINNKDKTNKYGVYKLKCDAMYVGQTWCNFDTGMKEQKTKISVFDNWKCMSFAEHYIDNRHIFNINDFQILYTY